MYISISVCVWRYLYVYYDLYDNKLKRYDNDRDINAFISLLYSF